MSLSYNAGTNTVLAGRARSFIVPPEPLARPAARARGDEQKTSVCKSDRVTPPFTSLPSLAFSPTPNADRRPLPNLLSSSLQHPEGPWPASAILDTSAWLVSVSIGPRLEEERGATADRHEGGSD